MRFLSLPFVLLLAATAALAAAPLLAHGAGVCGGTPPDQMALKLAPCASAAQDPGAAPPGGCCSAVRDIGRHQSAACLCAVLLSDTVKHSGVKPEVAITIPKRCNLANRPVGYKCGRYTLPSLQD
ncbi:non-specific lipid-transfer protein 1-like [Oryza brachyantha]|uniref:non-specific lipid-transfer protein 1-like n=1 Tax=Oryza brachyantha TaxID=4533 RepID=UPI001ADBEEA4|nr:non-specific lipid-transfer protein 1-like [Oryza brachyantha]